MSRTYIVLFLVLFAAQAMAAGSHELASRFDENGQVDLDALRLSGYEGPIDLNGGDVLIDPETGRPIFRSLVEKTNSDEPWAEGFDLPGFDGPVEAVCVYQGRVYVGGLFRTLGSLDCDNLAYYDGSTWHSFEESFGYEFGKITCMTVYNDSLVIGGDVGVVGPAGNSQHIVAFDGVQCHGFQTGFNGQPYDLLVLDGQLIAGGYFWYSGDQNTTFKHLARWTGTQWLAYGTGMSGEVRALCEFEGDLIVGGRFATANEVPVNGIARWNGSTFEPIWNWSGTGYANVKALLPYDGDLYVGGDFSAIEGRNAENLAVWNGINWQEVGGGITSSESYCYVQSLHEHADGVLVGGRFEQAGSVATTGAVIWNGTNYVAMAGGVREVDYGASGGVNDAVEVNGDWWLVGWFTRAGSLVAHSIALWDGVDWTPAPGTEGAGVESTVRALCLWNGDLIAGGRFRAAGSTAADYIARWDGNDWHPLGGGLDDDVTALAVWNGDLIVSGDFLNAGGLPRRHLARWDGVAWHDLGGGIDDGAVAMVSYFGKLYVGGDLSEAGELPVSNLTSWDRWRWSDLDGGVDGRVHTLLVADSQLLVGGTFLNAGGSPASRIASWDGSDWLEFAGGADGAVYALANYNGIVAGGEFLHLGGVPCDRIGRWNGASWEQLGEGFVTQECWMSGPDTWDCWNVFVTDLAVCEGRLFVNGITQSGSLPLRNLACWTDTDHWTPLGSGLPSTDCFCPDEGKLWIGGAFRPQLGSPAQCLVSWEIDRNPVDGDQKWWAGFDTMGTNGRISSLLDYQGQLLAAGYFTEAGGAAVGGVASWNGNSWTALGDGFGRFGSNPPQINKMIEWNGVLYAAGLFSVPPAPTTEHVSFARWNGTSWQPLMDALYPEFIYDLVLYGDDLVLIGNFTEVEGVAASGMALYDGTDLTVFPVTVTGDEWGGYFSGGVVYDGDLVVYGDFLAIDGVPYDNIARWNGSAWISDSDGFGANGNVREAIVDGNDLYIAGDFTAADGEIANGIARWDGLDWDVLGGGLSWASGSRPRVETMTILEGMVVSAGQFDMAGGETCSEGIAAWDGESWHDFGSGFILPYSYAASDLTVWNGDLYVAGWFALVGDKNADNIGRWIVATSSEAPPLPSAAPVVLRAAYPNPFNGGTTVRFELAEDADVQLAIYDVKGRLVRTLVDAPLQADTYEMKWNGRAENGADMPSGVYLVRLQAAGSSRAGKIVYVR
jgi:trimeric autotransporter adhesin